ncbi:oligosaccharide flippase family protein [Rhizobium sp. NRK18]|uniref:oligosaccharide flippase family protein n=1 Tax=Rhizobium sp. NRK18 TaxID=2964667 RepID=UPI0021C2AFCE|nr:oligosaccharide flippase family protein [Rhizobium sp. NRK18]MCQ2003096.1 oligosaccharide flippase family protein [Rhizobium sp. NRK18]
MAVIETAEKVLPPHLRARVAPHMAKLAAMLTGRDELAHAQRMALIAFVIRVVSAGIAFISQVILARMMGEFEYGIFVYVWVLVITFGDFACLGFNTTVIRFLPEYEAAGDHAKVRGMAFTARLFALVAASLLLAGGLAFLHVFGTSLPPYYVAPVFLGLFALPMIALGDVLDGTARANRWPINALSPTFVIRPTLIIVFMAIAVKFGEPRTAVTAMVAALAATYVTTVGQFVVVTIRLGKRFLKGDHSIHFGTWFKVALPIFFIEGFSFLLTNSDVVIVGIYLPPNDVAIYFAAAKTMALVQFVFFSVKAAAGPRFSTLFARNDLAGLASFANQTARWTFWPSLAIGIFVLLAGKLILSLFGEAFTAGYALMAILFLGPLFKSMIGPAESLLTMSGRQKACVAVYFGALIVNVALNMTLIPLWGLTGAAIATTGAILVETILLHLAVRLALGISLFVFADPMADQSKPEAR